MISAAMSSTVGRPSDLIRQCGGTLGSRSVHKWRKTSASSTLHGRRIRRPVSNGHLHTDDVGRAREFFRFLGLTEDGMDQGWVARFTSPDSGACVQVVTRDATAPEDSVMTIKVDDVDTAYGEAQRRGYGSCIRSPMNPGASVASSSVALMDT